MEPRGDFIDGRFLAPEGEKIVSRNPAREGEVVLETASSPERISAACEAAARAQPAWWNLSIDERAEALGRFRDAIAERTEDLADAITLEMGKLRSEARTEVDALVSRFASALASLRADVREGALPGQPNEWIGNRPHGVVGVIGPFNFPLHLCHVHVVPALLLGNTVVVKPSEVTPLAGDRYAEAARAAALPPGVINVVQGAGAEGAALVRDPRVRGLAFTGSWSTGRRIAEAALDRPEMLVALELGGKNACIVRSDADLRQAVHEIVLSGYLTTGQRCTCAGRVLVDRRRAEELIDALARAVTSLRFGDPDDEESFAGPLANEGARERFIGAIEHARSAGVEAIVPGGALAGGYYAAPSIHRLRDGTHHVRGYTDVELFGPDLAIETFDDDAEAIEALRSSPYGFAHSVFTRDRDAFERYFRSIETGILNLNRSTNQASARLPFGGVKRSGNFRPAGSWAHRNLSYPVAQIRNAPGVFKPHAQLTAHLPGPDLDRLEADHAAEEEAEAKRTLLATPRVHTPTFPANGSLPRSSALLERFYAGERYVREKKPPLFDHLRSSGPYYVSIDDKPLAVIDSMSQTATVPAGFAADRVVRAYVEGELGEAPLANVDSTLGDSQHARAFEELLKKLVPGFAHVSFVGSGAEANEKAYALCRASSPSGAKKLLAFEGSFHGRTLLALYASYNLQKRLPFQIAGYEVDFAPFPLWAKPDGDPREPDGWRELCARGDVDALEKRFGESDDVLLRAELKSLAYVARAIRGGEYFAVDIEPMQSEGGDRYAAPRFYRSLRLITRAIGVPMIMDEVQTGFGLGGTFLWHQRFGLIDADGNADVPDCVVFAKRAQVGVCMSRFADPEPTHAFAGSLARGRLHAELSSDTSHAARIEDLVRARLIDVERRWGHRIENARATGYALAFEVKDAAEMNAYLEQRFWRGAIVFGAGSRTIRYRFNSSFDERAIDFVFESIHRSLAWLEAHPGKSPPAWEDLPAPKGKEQWTLPFRVRVASPNEADALLPKIMEIEARAYEIERRDSEAHLKKAFAEDGVIVIAELVDIKGTRVVGSALGAPLEAVSEIQGPDRDPMLGRLNTLYSMAVTIDPEMHGHGLGKALKIAQLERAAAMKNADGSPRYRHVSGRNRLPEAGTMSRLNDALGAYTIAILDKQYGGAGVARYHRQPLGRFVPDPIYEMDRSQTIDLASGLARPFASPPPSIEKAWNEGALFGPAVNKITVLNYVTPAIVRATEWVAALTPHHPHAYLCSSRDETVDKSVRVLRWHRTKAQIVIGFEGGYVGHTTACARSISDPSVHAQGSPYFDWPRIPHPAEVGAIASMEALRETILRAGGAPSIFGIYIEPIQERTGRVVPDAFYRELAILRAETGVPIVFVETASAYYRSGRGPFSGSGIEVVPDLSIWWTGGQLGFVHATSAFHVAQPLTLVSTWDGDELSLVQMHHQLRAARSIDVDHASRELDAALEPIARAGFGAHGRGLYRVIDAGARADSIVSFLADRSIRVRSHSGRIPIVVRLDRAQDDARALAQALSAWT